MHKSKPEIYSRLRLKGNSIVCWGENSEPFRIPKNEQSFGSETREKKPYSIFGLKSRKRLKNALVNWIDTVNICKQLMNDKTMLPMQKHTFITLTLSSTQLHCDKILKRELMNKFLIYGKRYFNINNYIWKAEVQSNGNLHYHILSQNYIDHSQLRTVWNNVQNSLGYVDRFTEKNRKENPNSTDIHALQKIRNVEAYIGKYMSKNESVRPVCGHTWGKSKSIGNLLPYTLDECTELYDWLQLQINSLNPKEKLGTRYGWYGFPIRYNLKTLPSHHLKRVKEIADYNRALIKGMIQ